MSYNSDSGAPRKRTPKKPIYDPDSGIPPTEKQLARMKQYSRNSCVAALARSDKTRKQLQTKLYQKRIIPEIINEVLSELEEQNLLSDTRVAEQFFRSNKERTPVKTIKRKLAEKGVPSNIIEDVVTEDEPDVEYEKCVRMASTKTRSLSRIVDRATRKRRLSNFLLTRGFSWDVASGVVENLLDELEEDFPTDDSNDNW